MKINVTIDILPSEVLALLQQVGKQPEPAPQPEKPVVRIRVADNEKNQKSPYWKARINDEGSLLLPIPSADQVHIQFPEDAIPIYNVDVDRVIVIPS